MQLLWQTFLYITGLMISVYLLLTSRHLHSVKRWLDPSFLLGMAFFTWGIGSLFVMHADHIFRILAHVLFGGFYIFMLMAFQAFPLAPNLYFEPWKKRLDVAILVILYLTSRAVIWYLPVIEAESLIILRLHMSLFVFGMGVTVMLSNRKGKVWERDNWLLLGALGFLLVSVFRDVGDQALSVITLLCFAMIAVGYHHTRTYEENVEVNDEYYVFHEKLRFFLRDESMNWLFVVGSLFSLMSYYWLPGCYIGGMGIVTVLLVTRLVMSKARSYRDLFEIFELSRNLEKEFVKNMQEIQSTNDDMYKLLAMKQTYERLLMASNEQNMQDVHYENVHRLIEEIVKTWYDTINGLTYVGLELLNHGETIDFEVSYGSKPVDGQTPKLICVEIQVDDRLDSSFSSRYVKVNALTQEPLSETDDVVSLYRLLAIHVRGLLLRCIQTQQSMELRLVEQEMELASKIQFSLIPRERLVLPGLQAKVVYIPATYVGGDYVDFVRINDRYSCFLVADIAGHGIPASLLTTGLRSSFHAVLQTCFTPQEILERLNRLLYDDLSRTRSFVTIFVAVFDQELKKLQTSRAGHPEPLYLSASKQSVLPCAHGIGLGLIKNATYQQNEFLIEEDFMLLIYTDGLIGLGERQMDMMITDQWIASFTEAVSPFGNADVDRIEAVERRIWERTRSKQQDDDISVLILDVTLPKKGEQEG